jgi:hypothetical protein
MYDKLMATYKAGFNSETFIKKDGGTEFTLTNYEQKSVPLGYLKEGDKYILVLDSSQFVDVKSGLDALATRRKQTRISHAKRKQNGITKSTKLNYCIELPDELQTLRKRTSKIKNDSPESSSDSSDSSPPITPRDQF